MPPRSPQTEVKGRARPRRSPPPSRRPRRVRGGGILACASRVVAVWSVLDHLLCPSGCGAVLTDLEGSFTSPNHPGSYPPNLLCRWVIQVPPPFIVQIHVLSLAVEGPSPCLFDWLEVQEQTELRSVVTRSVLTRPAVIFNRWFECCSPLFESLQQYVLLLLMATGMKVKVTCAIFRWRTQTLLRVNAETVILAARLRLTCQ